MSEIWGSEESFWRPQDEKLKDNFVGFALEKIQIYFLIRFHLN